MSRRVLAPLLDESLPPKSLGIMLFDKPPAGKLPEPPASNMIIEVMRSAIWSINPLTETSSPVTEPDMVLRIDVLGTKLILTAMPHAMK